MMTNILLPRARRRMGRTRARHRTGHNRVKNGKPRGAANLTGVTRRHEVEGNNVHVQAVFRRRLGTILNNLLNHVIGLLNVNRRPNTWHFFGNHKYGVPINGNTVGDHRRVSIRLPFKRTIDGRVNQRTTKSNVVLRTFSGLYFNLLRVNDTNSGYHRAKNEGRPP